MITLKPKHIHLVRRTCGEMHRISEHLMRYTTSIDGFDMQNRTLRKAQERMHQMLMIRRTHMARMPLRPTL